jgi:hypothetical protein
MYETSYALIVPNEVTNVTIGAQTLSSTATISGLGQKALNVGQNTFSVVVTAQSGAQRTYTIQVVRQEPVKPEPEPEQPPVVTPMPEIGTDHYQLGSDSTITGIADFKTLNVASFKSKISVQNGTIQITTANGTKKDDSAKVGTGDQVRVYDNDGVLKYTHTVIVYGDTNGDGDISVLDLLRVQKDILGVGQLSGVYKTAADTNKKDGVTVLDLLQVQKELLGLPTVKQ